MNKTASAAYAPLLQAHRGVSTDYPENTMSAFIGAQHQGYKYIELDPAVTKDGKIVVLHDCSINRTARNKDGSEINEEIKISEITYGQALEYDFGIYKSVKFKNEKIPLLSEVLDFAKQADILIKIDNKIERFLAFELDTLFDILQKSEARVGITCKSVGFALAAAKRMPSAEIHFDGEVTKGNLDELAASIERERLVVWLNFNSACAEKAQLIKQYSRLGIWILSEEAEYKAAVESYAPDIIETTGSLKPEMRVGVLADIHTHSEHSHDSSCPIKAMAESEIQKGIDIMAVTDHCDIETHESVDVRQIVRDCIADAKSSNDLFESIEILRGTELGEAIWYPELAEKILAENPLDLVIGSVHAVRFPEYEMPYSQIDFAAMGKETTLAYLDKYFDEMLEMISGVSFDTLAHLTCPLRYINGKYGLNISCRLFEDKILNILKEIISRSIALEINTSCKGGGYGEFMPEEWIIKAYKQLGGHLVTLASDAHAAQNAAYYFDEALAMLKRNGFENIYYFKNRFSCQCKIN